MFPQGSCNILLTNEIIYKEIECMAVDSSPSSTDHQVLDHQVLDHQVLDPASDSDGNDDWGQPAADLLDESDQSSDNDPDSDTNPALAAYFQDLEFDEGDNQRLTLDELYQDLREMTGLDDEEEIWKFRESPIFAA